MGGVGDGRQFRSYNRFSMKPARPFTACKDTRGRSEPRTVLSRIKRPASAKTDSLKKIIQVIENTLNKGAQTLLAKTKTLEKFSKTRHRPDSTPFRLPHTRTEPILYPYRTAHLIPTQAESRAPLRSAKLIEQTDAFRPYVKQESLLTENEETGRKAVPLRKVGRVGRVGRGRAKREGEGEGGAVGEWGAVEGWGSGGTGANLSGLLEVSLQG